MKLSNRAPNVDSFKGIIPAAGLGTRLYPITLAASKPLLPVYDKPMIYYPLSVLMLAGIRDILIITTPQDISRYKFLLGDGSQLGIELSYAQQPQPEGIAQAIAIGREYIGNHNVCLILGDNIFYGPGFPEVLGRAVKLKKGCLIFGYQVKHPKKYGVIEFDEKMNVLGIEEKPKNPKSNYAVAGMYFFDNHVIEVAADLRRSDRGEFEMADVLNAYLRKDELRLEILGNEIHCLNIENQESLSEANVLIEAIEKKQNKKLACIEEIAYHMEYVDKNQLERLAERFVNSDYGKYLLKMVDDEKNGKQIV